MPKLEALNDLTTLGSAVPTINDNFDKITTALNNTLSRDGSTPNTMSADLDMNSNDILNVNKISVQTFEIDGLNLEDYTNRVEEAAAMVNNFTLFDSRNTMLTYLEDNAVVNGRTYIAGGAIYIGSTGATAIPDIPNMLPYGPWTKSHFGGDMAVALAQAEGYGVEVYDGTDSPEAAVGIPVIIHREADFWWAEDTTSRGKAARIIRNRTGAHASDATAGLSVEVGADGSTKNGPSTADLGMSINVFKEGYRGVTRPTGGEIDGLYVFVRQDGPQGLPSGDPGSSDAAAILVDARNVGDCGFIATMEGVAVNVDTAGTIQRAVRTQTGVINANNAGAPLSFGYAAITQTGTNDYAFYAVRQNPSTNWAALFHAPDAVTITNTGGYRIRISGDTDYSAAFERAAGADGALNIRNKGTGGIQLINEAGGGVVLWANNAARVLLNGGGTEFRPVTTNAVTLGTSSLRWSNVHTVNLLATGTIGYPDSLGAGSSVTQTGSKADPVTINTRTGSITVNNAALAAGASVEFEVNNSTVTANTLPFVAPATTSNDYLVSVKSFSTGRFRIRITNTSAGSLSQAFAIQFGLINVSGN